MAMPPEDLQPELELVRRMKSGDESAFVHLYRRHRDGVFRLALMYSGSHATAADVTQDAFIHFITHPAQYDATRGTLAAWLCGIARNLVRKGAAWREDATDPEVFESHAEHDTPLERVLRGEAAEQVRRAIASLAPHYRDVLILCEISELSYAEAAHVCGIDIGTVRSRLSRARARLAQSLAPYREGAKEAVT
jgi:RNA polymerase sigma-70 factor (ECF subfamily)